MTVGETTLERSAVHRALGRVTLPESERYAAEELSVTPVSDGVNDVFVVETGSGGERRLAVKFGTFSTPRHLRAGVGAYRLLGAYTDLPVPAVRAFEPRPDDLPPFVVLEHRPGAAVDERLGHAPDLADPAAVGTLGAVVREFGRIPATAADGYGFVEGTEATESGPRAVADYDDCAEMLVAYATDLYDDPPDHDALEAVAPIAPEYLRAERDRLPSSPEPSVVVTDLSPENLLSPDGDPPDDAGGLTGVVDLERAKIGPREFTAVNAEYLITRNVSNEEAVREALYDPLPFGPDLPARDLYRLVAMGRSVSALELWYDPGSEAYRERGEELAAEIERIVE